MSFERRRSVASRACHTGGTLGRALACLVCPKVCGRSNGVYTAQAECMNAHCAEVCRYPG